MLHSNSARFKLISSLGSAWWPLASHVSQDSVEHPSLPCELWFLSNTGTIQSVRAAVCREGRGSMLGQRN